MFRVRHSTETALLKVQNDVLQALDKGSAVALIMLDLLAAFDTIDHTILLSRLQELFGVQGQALSWFNSYLSHRTQRVSVGNVISDSLELDFGVPQGSVLAPTLYSLYTKPISDIIRKFDLSYHSYADDTQLYISIENHSNMDNLLAVVKNCVHEIKMWMIS